MPPQLYAEGAFLVWYVIQIVTESLLFALPVAR